MKLVTLIRRLMGIQSTLGSEYFSDREGAYQYKGTYCENRRSSILLNAIDQQAIALALLFLVVLFLLVTSLRSSYDDVHTVPVHTDILPVRSTYRYRLLLLIHSSQQRPRVAKAKKTKKTKKQPKTPFCFPE